MKPKNLQQRIAIFVLVPVFFILAGMGWASFLYARNAILKQWSETAIAKLQKASHMIDMRLSKTKDLLLMLENDESQSFIVQEFIINQLKNLEGVVEVNYDIPVNFRNAANNERMHGAQMKGMHTAMAGKFRFSLPKYNARLNSETISLSTDFIDKDGDEVGRIEVVISFQDLIEQISKANWWKSHNAFIIDNEGNILISTQRIEDKNNADQFVKFAQTDSLEKLTLDALSQSPYGTVFGPGHPPKEISGYYHLNEAPWSLVLISPGKQVLKSILNFRMFYFVIGFLSILSVVLFIRITISGTTKAIKKVSEAAKSLADGVFGEQLPVKYKDEVGELTFNFNRMTRQLKERIELKEAMDLAKEVQQSLLPPTNISYENLEISGRSVYCDETGGDFFDIIEFPGDSQKICVAVGDVVGHGVGAALLMATTRALLRGRITQGGSLSQVMTDVNRLLCLDSYESGSFVSLFLFMIDIQKRELRWIRAGHDPAMVYHPDKNSFMELYGDGLVLGLDEDFRYTDNIYSNIQKGTVILIGTDGVWEDENKLGDRFGKKRLENVLKLSSSLSSEEIVTRIISDGEKFRGKAKQMDDITLLVLKFL
ncbi:MAG: SpoIIE family protein phosphatase [Desulfobacula sp.]|nr:SpoIIE family protein phosphatase [Desulfobacula sp.]